MQAGTDFRYPDEIGFGVHRDADDQPTGQDCNTDGRRYPGWTLDPSTYVEGMPHWKAGAGTFRFDGFELACTCGRVTGQVSREVALEMGWPIEMDPDAREHMGVSPTATREEIQALGIEMP